MMASERPVSTSETEQIQPETSQEASTPAPAVPKPTHGTLPPSSFINGFDVLLATGLAILVFALASFAVKNPDFWLHLGIGRVIAEGNYEFGKAPFSYVGADRYWANHSWLFELLTFKLYSIGEGQGVVVFKAILLTLLAIVLLSVRKQGQSLWFGVLLVGLAFLASAPRLYFQPTIFSYTLLGVTVYLLVQEPPNANRWRLPLGLGITFGLWSNLDQWFFIGPVVVALYLMGEFLQRKILKPIEGSTRPPLASVAVGLGVGIVACMLNPHHFHVWELPPELLAKQLGSPLGKEVDLAGLVRSIFDKNAFDFDGSKVGNPINAFAASILLVLYILGLALNLRQFSWGAALATLVLLIVAVIHTRALPFFAFAAAPITAVNLGDYSRRIREKTYTVGSLQLLRITRLSSRLFLASCGLVALAASWPGWLHPLAPPQRRISWDVEPDPSLQKAALLLDQWRKEGMLPPEARTLILEPELASYCAWYAPQERFFMDTRYNFHAGEIQDFYTLRRIFIPQRNADKQGRPVFNLAKFLRTYNITHVVVSSAHRPDQLASFESMLGMFLDQQNNRVQVALEPDWQLCGIAGRVSIFGWRHQQVIPEDKYKALLFEPISLAFGADVKPLPDVGPESFSEKRGFGEKYLTPLPQIAAESEESILLNRYTHFLQQKFQSTILHPDIVRFLVQTTYTVFAAPISSLALVAMNPIRFPPIPAELYASSYLAVRRAREGILSSPDHPEGYRALAVAYGSQQFFSIGPDFQANVAICSNERYFLRLTPQQLAADRLFASDAAEQLTLRHFPEIDMDPPPEIVLNPNQNETRRYDLCLKAYERKYAIMKAAVATLQLTPDQRRAILQRPESKIAYLEKKVHSQENLWLNACAATNSHLQRGLMAIYKFGLVQQAIDEFKKAKESESEIKISLKTFFGTYVELARLYIITGQAELADQTMKELETDSADFRKSQINEGRELQNHMRPVKLQTALVLGRFSEAIQMESEEEANLVNGLTSINRANLFKPSAKFIGRAFLLSGGIAPVERVNNMEDMVKLMPPIKSQTEADDAMLLIGYGNMKRGMSENNFRMAMIYLEQGDNRSAAYHLRQYVDSLGGNLSQRSQNRDMAVRNYFVDIVMNALPKQ